jgi:hypothetical protein
MQVEKQVDIYFIIIAASVVDPPWFQCGFGYGSMQISTDPDPDHGQTMRSKKV